MTASGTRPPTTWPFGGSGQLARALFADAPRRCVLVLTLLLASAITETFGLALLIPLLSIADLGGGAGGASGIRQTLETGAGALGITLTLPVLLGAYVLLSAMRSGVAWQRQVQITAIRHGFVERRRKRLYAAIAHSAWSFLVRQRQSDLLHVLTHDVDRAGHGAMCIMRGAVTATFALAQLALASAISVHVTFGMAVVGGTLLAAGRPLLRRTSALGRQLTTGGRATHAAMTGFLGGLKQVKSDSAETRHVRDFSGALVEVRRAHLAFTRIEAWAQAVFNVGASAVLAVLVWLALRYGGLSTPELLVMAIIAVRVLPAMRRLHQEGQQLAHALPAWQHAIEMERVLLDAAEPPASPGAEPMRLRHELTVRRVSFTYEDPPAGGSVLQQVHLVIPAQCLVAITGPSGAGKTTLADLLLGLIEPDQGEVCVDGVRLDGAVRRSWRRSVAYVAQEPHLFHETIRTNLLRARPGATEAELWRGLRRAAAGFVAALPHGLETVVGDRGARLSGGERQRIVLARALLREPALLLLDEATSQLDAGSEREVLTALRSLRDRTTVVAVTHRPAVMQMADLVVLLQAGRVAATGTWRELAPRLAGDSQDWAQRRGRVRFSAGREPSVRSGPDLGRDRPESRVGGPEVL